MINFKDEAHIHKLNISDYQCDQCEATILHVTFHKVSAIKHFIKSVFNVNFRSK